MGSLWIEIYSHARRGLRSDAVPTRDSLAVYTYNIIIIYNMYGIRKRDGSHDHLALDNEFIARGNAQRISLSALIFLIFSI